jgi:ProP effector
MSKKLEHANKMRNIIVQLAEKYPGCFFIYYERRRPLALGIRALISVDGVSDADLQLALQYYVWSAGYLRASVAGAARVGLDGSAAGSVSEAEAVFAANKLAAVRKRANQKKRARKQEMQARKKAKEQEQTPAPAPAPAPPARLSLGDLRAAAAARRASAA